MFNQINVYRLIIALGLVSILALSACSPPNQADGAPLPPKPDGDGAASGQAYVEDLSLMMLESFPVQVRAQISGQLSDGCTEIKEITTTFDEGAQTFTIRIETERDAGMMCTQALVPFEETVDLEVRGLAAGTYTVEAGEESATFTLQTDNEIPSD
jgi:inhibitor of cysteine peptidase